MENDMVLEQLEIASPCKVNWDDMAGTDQVRSCQQCQLSVYNISEMSRHDAEELLRGANGRMCIRMYKRHDGTVITQDCPVGLRAIKKAASEAIRRVGRVAAVVVSFLMTVAMVKAEPSKPGSQKKEPGVTDSRAS